MPKRHCGNNAWLVLLTLATCVGAAAAKDVYSSAYPLRVQIVETGRRQTPYGVTGYGKGNLQQGGQISGFEYTYDCSTGFLASQGSERYPARWKKVGTKLAILTTQIGNDSKRSECELEVSIRPFIFGVANGQVVVESTAQLAAHQAAQRQLQRELNPPDKDPSHYPIKLFILSVEWGDKTESGDQGTGFGNLQDGDRTNAVDFTIWCSQRLAQAPEERYLWSRWYTPYSRLNTLVPKPGDPSGFNECKLNTNVQPSVYVKQPSGSITTLSQAQYAAQQQTSHSQVP